MAPTTHPDPNRPWAWSEAELGAAHRRLLQGAPLFDIEAAASCNAVCGFCPREALVRPKRVMTPETFEAVVRFLPDEAVVMFAGLGEPLMNRRLPEFVRRLADRGVSSCVITNGMLMTPRRQCALVEAGIDQIQVSVHARDPAVVRELMPSGVDPAVVEKHVERLARTRPEGLRVRLNVVVTERNQHEVPALRAWARSLGIGLFVREQHNRGGEVGGVDAIAAPGCGVLASVTFIDAEGLVASCVNDVRSASRLAHVRDLAWADVLRWKTAELVRGPAFPACGTCDDGYRWTILRRGSVNGGEEAALPDPRQGGAESGGAAVAIDGVDRETVAYDVEEPGRESVQSRH